MCCVVVGVLVPEKVKEKGSEGIELIYKGNARGVVWVFFSQRFLSVYLRRPHPVWL